MTVITLVTVGVPTWVLEYLNLPGFAGLVGVTTLGALIATASAGTRAGITFTIGASGFIGLAVLAGSNVLLATLVMSLAALALGVSALRGWQSAMVLAPIVMGFVIAEPPQTKFSLFDDAVTFAFCVFFFALVAVLLVTWLAGSHGHGHLTPVSRQKMVGYTIMLVGATLITTPIALLSNWGHTGGWLIMTPLIVLQPYRKDGVRRGLARITGTVAGFVLVALILTITDSPTILVVVGVGFAMATMWAITQRWNYAVYAFFLTPAVVVLEGLRTSVESTAQDRVYATALGVGIALAFIVALALLNDRDGVHRGAGLT